MNLYLTPWPLTGPHAICRYETEATDSQHNHSQRLASPPTLGGASAIVRSARDLSVEVTVREVERKDPKGLKAWTHPRFRRSTEVTYCESRVWPSVKSVKSVILYWETTHSPADCLKDLKGTRDEGPFSSKTRGITNRSLVCLQLWDVTYILLFKQLSALLQKIPVILIGQSPFSTSLEKKER